MRKVLAARMHSIERGLEVADVLSPKTVFVGSTLSDGEFLASLIPCIFSKILSNLPRSIEHDRLEIEFPVFLHPCSSLLTQSTLTIIACNTPDSRRKSFFHTKLGENIAQVVLIPQTFME